MAEYFWKGIQETMAQLVRGLGEVVLVVVKLGYRELDLVGMI